MAVTRRNIPVLELNVGYALGWTHTRYSRPSVSTH